ncbi:MAG TPA: S8 family serine peptidase, partial [Tepidisphaeraceae bacterium]|nr:S8 family serine peptidase [Tepidisphaeraceae bacterium]
MHNRPSRPSSSHVETLEDRRLLSGAPQAVIAKYEPIQWQGQQAYTVPGQWLLQMKDVAGGVQKQLQTVNQLLDGVGANAKATRHLGRDGLVLLKAHAGTTHAKLHGVLKKLAKFSAVEPDLAVWSAATTSNDPSLSSQWALNNTGQTGGTPDADINAPEAWDRTTGNGSVVVGVIDSGVDYNHPDLKANVWVNAGEVAGNGADDDGNGYVDDVRGWDFRNNDNDPADDNG